MGRWGMEGVLGGEVREQHGELPQQHEWWHGLVVGRGAGLEHGVRGGLLWLVG